MTDKSYNRDYQRGRHQAIGDLRHQTREACQRDLEWLRTDYAHLYSADFVAGYTSVLNGDDQ